MNCSHITKVLEWGFDADHNFMATLWGCVLCDATSDKPFKDEDAIEIDHTMCDDDCFGCKARGLQMNTGDAGRDISDKSWNNRLAFYRKAKEAGIQPNGTHPAQVEAAYKASENLGKAYDGGTMPRADKVTKTMAATIKEVEKA